MFVLKLFIKKIIFQLELVLRRKSLASKSVKTRPRSPEDFSPQRIGLALDAETSTGPGGRLATSATVQSSPKSKKEPVSYEDIIWLQIIINS